VKKLILASPRGFCAGVTRAIEIVEKALEVYGPPIYVKHEIVHNHFVVENLRKKGAIFVEELEDVPEGAQVIFSAHGVPPKTFDDARVRSLQVTDATCPLVTKVHKEAARFAKDDYEILLIGHKNHVEAIGTQGVAPEKTTIVENIEDAAKVQITDPDKLAVLTQTTLSVDDTKEVLDVLKGRFEHLKAPKKSDICYATTNRQTAIKQICEEVDLVLVVGSRKSSNSNRLREVAQKRGVNAYLINDESEIEEKWLEGVDAIGMTAGASTPEWIIESCINRLKELGVQELEERSVVSENVSFQLPKNLKDAIEGKKVEASS